MDSTVAHNVTDLRDRTKKFALRIINLYQNLPRSGEAQVISPFLFRQLTPPSAITRNNSAFIILHSAL